MGAAGRRRTAGWVRTAAVAMALGVGFALTSCSGVDLSCARGDPALFVGVATSVDGGAVRYRSERVLRPGRPPVPGLGDGGVDIRVTYPDGNEQFIEPGRSYQVEARPGPSDPSGTSDPSGPRLVSDVHATCGPVTTNADGSRIDTGPMARTWVRQLVWGVLGVVGVLVLVGTVAAVISGFLERREDRELEEI